MTDSDDTTRSDRARAGSDAELPFMRAALDEARRAAARDEVPVGAVVVRDGCIVGRGHNVTRERRDPTAHAEMLAIADALERTGEKRLDGCRMYVTLEPCFMCAGAISHARLERVVWATRDPKFGACASLGHVLTDARLNHRAEIAEGLCADESSELLRSFFREIRAGRRADAEADDAG